MSSPDQLKVDTSQLYWDAADVTVPDVPTVEAGGDPMSLMVSHVMPTIANDLTTKIAQTKAREQKLQANLSKAKQKYQGTDEAAQQDIHNAASAIDPNSGGRHGFDPAAANASPPGSEMGQLGQIMGMAMQGIQQAAQIPGQIMSSAGQIPQGVTQGVQGIVQQASQASGAGNADTGQNGAGTPGAANGPGPSGGQKDQAKDKQDADAGQPDSTKPDKQENRDDKDHSGASGGAHREHAPIPTQSDPPPVAAPGRHRPPTSPEIAL